jgi:hypothetical protein
MTVAERSLNLDLGIVARKAHKIMFDKFAYAPATATVPTVSKQNFLQFPNTAARHRH